MDLNRNFPILLAEDHVVTRKLLEKKLVQAGHEVTSVENGREALRLFENRFFPIILTDWIMPEMDGLELCRAIRKMHSKGYVYIVLLTAKDGKDDIILGLESGADDYLTKPIDHLELIARLNTAKRILSLEKSLKDANEENILLSVTDSLTGCYNRGYLNETLPNEIERARRYDHDLSIVFCDIDHFKKVNDTHGHQVGDLVLKEFVQRIRELVRDKVDWIARYGGEEFMVVLPETDVTGACSMAKRLRSSLADRKILVHDKILSVTSSFGVTGINLDTSVSMKKFDTIIGQVDKFLYQAKEKGRDCIVSGVL